MKFSKLEMGYAPYSNDSKRWRELSEIVTGQPVLGFTGLSESSGKLTWTDDIAEFASYSTTTSGNYVSVSSPLDTMFPYNEIEEFTDSESNVFVKFPKCYIKFVENSEGDIDGFKVSKVKAEADMFIPDCFLNPSDEGATYLDYFALGKYEASGTTSYDEIDSTTKCYSKSGKTCLENIYLEDARTEARAYGTADNYYNGYQLLDFSMVTFYNFLCMLYYKTANIQTVYAGRVNSSSASVTGTCDGVNGKNGWNTSSYCVKMLGIENPYGNIWKYVDGAYYRYSEDNLYACRFPHKFSSIFTEVKANSATLGFGLPDSGYIKALKNGPSGQSRSYVYVPMPKTGGSSSTYVGDAANYGVGSIGPFLSIGGDYNESTKAGLWHVVLWASTRSINVGSRLAYRPVKL
jgi:hypothetical protein